MNTSSKLTVALLLAQALALNANSAETTDTSEQVVETASNEGTLEDDASCANPYYKRSYADDLYATMASPVSPYSKYPPGKWGEPKYTPNAYELGALVYGCDYQNTSYEQCCDRYAVFDYKLEHPAYQHQSAYCKHQILKENLVQSRVPNPWPLDHQFKGHFKQNQAGSFDHFADTMPGARAKYIHSSGLIAEAVLNVDGYGDHPYTGILKSGGKGIIRMSDLDVGINRIRGMTPSFAFKALRDYTHSCNLFGALASDGAGANWNWFDHTLSSTVAPSTNGCTQESNSRHALDATVYISTVSNWDCAEWDRWGYVPDQIYSPAVIYYEPVGLDFPREFHGDWTLDLQMLKAGTVLYKVYGCDTPREYGGRCYAIGDLTTTSDFYTSEWGDNALFFQHTRIDVDIGFNRELKDMFFALRDREPLNETGIEEPYPEGEFGCPFAFLFAAHRAKNYLPQPW